MRQRITAALLAILISAISLTSLSIASDVAFNDDPLSQNASTVEGAKPKKKKNIFARAFGALGKIFGRGKSDGKIQRMTEKDQPKFESAAAVRVTDSRTPAAPPPESNVSPREHLAQGRALLNSGRLNDAIMELSLAASLDPKLAEAYNLIGVAYDRKGMRERAKDAYEQALRAARNDAQTLNNLGYSLYLSGDYDGAVERLKRAAKLAPHDQRILNNLALAQFQLGKYDDAYKNFARASGEYLGRVNIARRFERVGMLSEAIKHYQEARRLQPASIAVLQRLVDLYQRVGQRDEAEQARLALSVATGKTIAAK